MSKTLVYFLNLMPLWIFLVLIAWIFISAEIEARNKYKYKTKIDYSNMKGEFLHFYKNVRYKGGRNQKEIEDKISKSVVSLDVIRAILIGIIIFAWYREIVINETAYILPTFFCTIVIAYIILFIVFKRKAKMQLYRNYYKNIVVSDLIKQVDSDFLYEKVEDDFENLNLENLKEQEKKIGKKSLFNYDEYMKVKNIFIDSELTIDAYNRFLVEDTITGWNNNITLHEIDLKRVESDGDGGTTTIDVFHGIFAYLITDTKFTTVIRIRKKDKKLRRIWKNEKIEMGLMNFDKYFDIYSENEFETKQILTHSLINLLLEFYEKTELLFEITLKENLIYMRFFIQEMYEPDIMNEKKNREKLYSDYCILKNIRDLFNELGNMFGITRFEEEKEAVES